ncbi:hypothetical protein BATDEDRAFT_24301 [Batrachochytrium dendrobatidis JAM81]|uniref:Uncharacterized protein n=1 Tax=Batrachochytrium dendrobatidis (strain JAM81 / FGSC 10211) TaxID=684364 RepID=F4P2F3_BATDJ|nr:uncharacterized protein BATDEDRAFT_24301 [Batrachochytrium dendrobatidis JAM81]EGF80580.1 hypothetical protein BATDEDRAFT_24301 [Batrachochytrium dendrobatidis JAM81]|eukprot:XP_006678402.1 hypothetical protein BATDEDRAFT_24301 [Batrachochytrium dendrobatidis JAM81]
MKLAITVLSSILAVCSITVANPILTTATTSTESSTSTVIPSSTTSAESTPTPIFDPKEVNCDPFSSNEVVMIQTYARDRMFAKKVGKELNEKESEAIAQRNLIVRLKRRLEDLKSKPWENGGASNYGETVENLENEISRQITVYEGLKKQSDNLDSICFDVGHRVTDSETQLMNLSPRYRINTGPRHENMTLEVFLPGFTKCVVEVNSVLLDIIAKHGFKGLFPKPETDSSEPETEESPEPETEESPESDEVFSNEDATEQQNLDDFKEEYVDGRDLQNHEEVDEQDLENHEEVDEQDLENHEEVDEQQASDSQQQIPDAQQ